MAIFDGKRMIEKYEYKTVDTSTEKGILEAERLHQTGWKILRSGLFQIQFERELKTKRGK